MPITTTVKDVITRDIISVETTDPVMKAINLMIEKNIGSIVITENQKPVGILTERDVLKRVCPKGSCGRGVKVGAIMSKPLIYIDPDTRLGQAALLMTKKEIRRLLVKQKGKIVGIVTQKDIMKGTLDAFISLASI